MPNSLFDGQLCILAVSEDLPPDGLPHNLYCDLSHGDFSPSLFQLVAFGRIYNYRLRDWLRVFGFDIEAIPRFQIELTSKPTALLESSLDDPNSRIP